MAKSITLLIPGLLDHLPDPVPRLPALETLLARADCSSDLPVGYERTLMHLFSQSHSLDHDVPEGALSRYAQTGEKPDGVWLCAAPVHLFADQSRVYLNAIDEAALNESEAEQFIAELNKVYSDDGWEFVQHTSTRWYLRIPTEPNIRTTPLRDVDGKPIHDKLPQGDDALQWHRVLNEMQMLLHSSPVNMARQERGKTTANGIWLWGIGELPEMANITQWQTAWTDVSLAQGLALLNSIDTHNLLPDASHCLQQLDVSEQLVVFAPLSTDNVSGVLHKLESDWFNPLCVAMQNGTLENVVLVSTEGRQWTLHRRHQWYIWRRRKSLYNYKKSC